MGLKLYTYEKCGTCRKAVKFLAGKGIRAKPLPIREQPPAKAELKRMLEICGGDVRKLFNTSGRDYQSLDMRTKLPDMSAAEAIDLLSRNGNLVKRPFLLTDKGGTVGFDETKWEQLLG
jgi:arsenate reductase